MKKYSILVALLIVMSALSLAGEIEAIPSAEAAAESWLSLTDAHDFSGSWQEASSLFKTAVTRSDWEKALFAARHPLGQVRSRELASAEYSTTLPGAPDGEYVVLTFDSSFESKKAAVETLAIMLDDDDSWRVSGYFIK